MISSEQTNTSEIEFLLHCVRCRWNPEDVAYLRQSLNAPLRWDFILTAASKHGLLALMFGSLSDHNLLDLVPEPAKGILRAAVTSTAARTLALTGELLRILAAFQKAGIPSIPCKGPSVAVSAYGDFSLRSFCDLDILVKADQLTRAREVLTTLGYATRLPLNPQQERDYLKNECALQLRNEARGHIVELHWRFSERNASVALPVAAFWDRAIRMQLAGTQISTLCPEDLIIYLCVHGAKHRWERIEWISCVAGVIRMNPALDWNAALQRAEQYGVRRLLILGLLLTQTLLATPLPPVVEQHLAADRDAAALARWVRDELFSTAAEESHYQQRAARYLFMLRSREHWTDRFRILLFSAIRLPHPYASEWLDLPPRWAFLHHVFRPVRLLGEYSVVAWRHYLR